MADVVPEDDVAPADAGGTRVGAYADGSSLDGGGREELERQLRELMDSVRAVGRGIDRFLAATEPLAADAEAVRLTASNGQHPVEEAEPHPVGGGPAEAASGSGSVLS